MTATASSHPLEGSVLLAGFDAGQTHTLCRLATAAGEPLAEGEGPGVSHLASPEGPRRFQDALRESLVRARARLVNQQAPQGVWPLGAAAIGASGMEQGSGAQAQGLLLAAATLGLPEALLVVTGDERTALAGAFPKGEGILVISGTGTIAIGRDREGRHHRCGGWGWLLDGAGSAMDIGRDALSLTLRMADGRHADGPLREELWKALGLELDDPQAPQSIKARVVSPDFGPAGFAALAPLVDRRAAARDGLAVEILRRNGEALVEMVGAVATRLELVSPPVCALGGAITRLPTFRQAYLRSLSATWPRVVPREPAGDGCTGALSLAAERLARGRGCGLPPRP